MSIRWGIVGCGDVCEIKSGPALYKVPGSTLQCVMRRNSDLARGFAERHGANRYTTDVDDLIGDPAVDIVYVATPPGSHLEYALRVADAGKPCLVEKPMARNANECQLMIQAFERAGQPLFVAYYRRTLPRFTRVKQILETGELGQLISVHHDFIRSGPARAPEAEIPWREDAANSGGGLFLDLGSHVLDLMDFLVEPIGEVSGYADRRPKPKSAKPLVENSIQASLRFPSGILGGLSYAFDAAQSRDCMRLLGDKGSLEFSVFGSEPLELKVGNESHQIIVEQPVHVHQPLVETIVEELRSGKICCPSRGHSALRASQAIDAILRGYYAGREDAFWTRPETWGEQSQSTSNK
ncbi:MAG: Gfo/Idh/MocA family oxidoreductase [Myxococcales bacterium]|nr:Gfo/Idh/MocA family oxidoreductase [Myxococcales bacterium]